MAASCAWTVGSVCVLSQLQPKHAALSGNCRQCCTCRNSAPHWQTGSPVSSSFISISWKDQRRNLSLAGGRRADRVRLIVRGSQEAGTSTLLVQEVEFTWKGQGSEVLLTGDFLQWETKVPLEKGPNGSFTLKKKLPVGKFMYKFIVDGEWKHSADSPTVPDGIGGFNNEIIVADPEVKGAIATTTDPGAQTAPALAPAKEPVGEAEPAKPKPKPVAAAAGDGSKPTPKAAKKAPAVKKSLEATMLEDVIPQLTATLEKEEGLLDLTITFEDNQVVTKQHTDYVREYAQLKTSFTKGDVPYCHWAFFPDGTLEGSRGASLTSHGSPPSTLEPFLVDENKITPELVVFWIRKRLFAQKILSLN